MPQPPLEAHNPEYLRNLSAVIAGLVTVLVSMVGYITHGFKKAQEGQQDQLDEGTAEFTSLKLRVQHLEDDNKALREWCVELEKDLDEALKELALYHDFRLSVQFHHEKQHGEKL